MLIRCALLLAVSSAAARPPTNLELYQIYTTYQNAEELRRFERNENIDWSTPVVKDPTWPGPFANCGPHWLIQRWLDLETKEAFFWLVLKLAPGPDNTLEKGWILQAMVERGVNVNMVDEFGDTPLTRAVRERHNATVVTLLRLGADVDALAHHHTLAYNADSRQLGGAPFAPCECEGTTTPFQWCLMEAISDCVRGRGFDGDTDYIPVLEALLEGGANYRRRYTVTSRRFSNFFGVTQSPMGLRPVELVEHFLAQVLASNDGQLDPESARVVAGLTQMREIINNHHRMRCMEQRALEAFMAQLASRSDTPGADVVLQRTSPEDDQADFTRGWIRHDHQ